MMIKIGIIEYERPTEYVKFSDIKYIISVSGKDVISLAWKSLNPNKDKKVCSKALASWLCAFFNMGPGIEEGFECVKLMADMDLLSVDIYYGTVKPLF